MAAIKITKSSMAANRRQSTSNRRPTANPLIVDKEMVQWHNVPQRSADSTDLWRPEYKVPGDTVVPLRVGHTAHDLKHKPSRFNLCPIVDLMYGLTLVDPDTRFHMEFTIDHMVLSSRYGRSKSAGLRKGQISRPPICKLHARAGKAAGRHSSLSTEFKLDVPTGITWGDLADGFENSPIEFTAYNLSFGVASELDDALGAVDDPDLVIRVEGVVPITSKWVAEAKAARTAVSGGPVEVATGQMRGEKQPGVVAYPRAVGRSTGAG